MQKRRILVRKIASAYLPKFYDGAQGSHTKDRLPVFRRPSLGFNPRIEIQSNAPKAESQRPPSPAEPVSELRRIPIRECREPLVDYRERCPDLVIAQPVFDYTRAALVRMTVAEMLNRAATALPRGYRLGILEGWRPVYIQRRMYLTTWNRFKSQHPDWSDVKLRRVVNRFTAPPEAPVPPPHSTGGAVDVFLVDSSGKRIDHSHPYELLDSRAFSMHAKGLDPESERHRTILREAMLHGGMTNYPSEWWHWSYGDQGWAYRAPQGSAYEPTEKVAIYGPIFEPDGWSPTVEDVNDDPLIRLDAAERSRRSALRD